MRYLGPVLATVVAACATSSQATIQAPSTTSVPAAIAGELPRQHAAQPTTGAITPADLMTHLYIISDDSMLGREAGQLGNFKATTYIAQQFERLGLRPGGENGTWFQTVPVVISRLDTTHTLSVAGAPLVIGTDVLPFPSSAVGVLLPQGTARSLDNTQVVYGGVLGSGNLIAPAQAAGKVIVFGAPTVNGQRNWRFWSAGSLAQYAAAAGIVVPVMDVWPRERLGLLVEPQERVQEPGPTAAAPTVLIVTPAAALRLVRAASLDNLAVGTAGATVSGTLSFREDPAPYPARNVIAILPGSDPALAGQYVAIGAHNDHIGLADHPVEHDSVLANNIVIRRQGGQDPARQPNESEREHIVALRDSLRAAHGGPRPDSVFNGADDDGSGTVALLEIAERFATQENKPRRSMLFVSHTGEEKGLWGSEYFTDHPTVPRDSIVAQLNMDMVGRGKATDAMGRGPNNIQLIGPSRLSTQLGALIDSLNAVRTPRMDIDYSFDANGHPLNRYCRSDHYSYARYGIPITYFSLGYHTDYHQLTDEPQYIDYGHMARIAQFVHDIAEAVANRQQRLVVDHPKPDPRGGCRQ